MSGHVFIAQGDLTRLRAGVALGQKGAPERGVKGAGRAPFTEAPGPPGFIPATAAHRHQGRPW
jgi:hypothetical protein